MSKSKRPTENVGTTDATVAEAVARLADEVRVLRDAIDEFREIFTWDVRSGKLRFGNRQQGASESDTSADYSELTQDEGHQEQIAAAMQEGLQDVASDLEEAVRDQLKNELAEFRDSLDQFSIDIQWAVRQVRQASTPHHADASSSRAAEATGPDNPTTEHPAVESAPAILPARQTSTRDARQPLLFHAE